MDWKDDPATEKQLLYICLLHHQPDRPLTKHEASELIAKAEQDPETPQAFRKMYEAIRNAHEEERNFAESRDDFAFYLRQNVADAKEEVANAQAKDVENLRAHLRSAIEERLTFWKDTFRDVADTEEYSLQGIELHLEFGHRFHIPTSDQVQTLINALDASSATWDKDDLSLFYKFLEQNFPELVRIP